jgi:uncharacterized protein YbjT (DUF2867 family)
MSTAMQITRRATVALMALILGNAAVLQPASAELASVGESTLDNLKGKSILLAGATGNNGQYVLSRLYDLGLNVRAMSRDVEDARDEFGTRYDWVKADVLDPASLTAAMDGVDVVISAVAASMNPFASKGPEEIDYQGTKNLAAAAVAAGATRFVIITSSSSGERDHFLNTIGKDVLIWKGKAEEVLVASGLEYVVVGPAAIDDSPGGEKAISIIPRSEYERGMSIGRHDLAAVVIAAAGHPDAVNRVFTATNSEGAASDAWLASFATLPTDLNLPQYADE